MPDFETCISCGKDIPPGSMATSDKCRECFAPIDELDALKLAVTALNTAPSFAIPALGMNSYKLIPYLETIIREAEKI